MEKTQRKYLTLKYFVLAVCLLILTFLSIKLFWPTKAPTQNSSLPKKQLEILVTDSAGKTKAIKLQVELAQTKQELELGLSNRDSLEEGTGMYFELGSRQIANFWMKDMRFPIDIIWIDENKIVGIEKNAPATKDSIKIATFSSPSEITNVLEVNAGFSDKNSIKAGDRVKLID